MLGGENKDMKHVKSKKCTLFSESNGLCSEEDLGIFSSPINGGYADLEFTPVLNFQGAR